MTQLHLIISSVTLLLVILPHITSADFFTRQFRPPCPFLPDPPPQGYLRWSSARTWSTLGAGAVQAEGGLSPGTFIPGVGPGEGANVSIPCGTGVLLDVPSLSLFHLNVKGLLRVEDPLRPWRIDIRASFVTVQGRLAAGTFSDQFTSQLVVTLTPNKWGRNNLILSAPAAPTVSSPSTALDSADVGHKAFAVVGGQLDLHGMPGGGSTPSWVKLSATILPGHTHVRVNSRFVFRRWPVGAHIVVASTSFAYDQSEERTIVGYGTVGSDYATVIVDRGFEFMHYGDPRGIPDGFGGFVDETAEVGLLTRNIVIQGSWEEAPFETIGGHLILFHTASAQFIEGVELSRMGQLGNLGRYPLHWHVCADTGGKSVIRKNSIHHTFQRCVVVHATHNVTIEGTVTFNSTGHCFLTEEGAEQDNVFKDNLGIYTKRATKKVTPQESDESPSIFWMSNMLNHYEGNVAVGSQSSGFWMETRRELRGMSVFVPDLAWIVPRFTAGGLFKGNVVHSNGEEGIKTYAFGLFNYLDLRNGTRLTVPNVFENLRVFQNPRGLVIKGSRQVMVRDSVFADNLNSILDLNNNQGVIQNCLFVGRTPNFVPGPGLTSLAELHRGGIWSDSKQGVFGILVSPSVGNASPVSGLASSMENLQFSGFGRTSFPSAAFTVAMPFPGSTWFNAWNGFRAVEMTRGTQAVWFPWRSILPSNATERATVGELVLGDLDSSIIGGRPGRGGYLVVNSTEAILPPSLLTTCAPIPEANAFRCPGACYHTVQVQYQEPAAASKQPGYNYSIGDFSYLELVREEDRQRRVVPGDLFLGKWDQGDPSTRTFGFTLHAGSTYQLLIRPPHNNPNFYPSALNVSVISYVHRRNCNESFSLTVFPVNNRALLVVAPSSIAFPRPCPRDAEGAPWWEFEYKHVAKLGMQGLEIDFTPGSNTPLPTLSLLHVATSARRLVSDRQCGLFPSSTVFRMDLSGAEHHNGSNGVAPFADVDFRDNQWAPRQAMIGRYEVRPGVFGGQNLLKWATEPLRQTTTYYFRNTFQVSQKDCYSELVIDFFPVFGLVVYLNGNEVYRFNLPSGPLEETTMSTAMRNSPSEYEFGTQTLSIDGRRVALREGVNVLAYEVHKLCRICDELYFDARASLIDRGSCGK